MEQGTPRPGPATKDLPCLLEGSRTSQEKEHAGIDAGECKEHASTKIHAGAYLGETKEDAGRFMPKFEMFPAFLRIGPWSKMAYLFLGCFLFGLLVSTPMALESFEGIAALDHNGPDKRIRALNLLLAVWCVGVQVFMVRRVGWWPYASFTMMSWSLLTLRLICNALGVRQLAEAVRYPVLANACITTGLWWLIMVPAVFTVLPMKWERRWRFLKFNFTFLLINVHLLNLALAVLDHKMLGRPLVFWDLWVALIIAAVYFLFYLLVLDASGLHFYIFLSPRPWWCILVYTGILGLYVGMWRANW